MSHLDDKVIDDPLRSANKQMLSNWHRLRKIQHTCTHICHLYLSSELFLMKGEKSSLQTYAEVLAAVIPFLPWLENA